MNNKEMLKVVQNVFDNVIDPTAIPTLRKGFSTGTPWGKAILDLINLKEYLELQIYLENDSKTLFDLHMKKAIKVRFKAPIWEDDFPERGMIAWLTKIEVDEKRKCYKLYFDFSEFEAENDKYFTANYYDSIGVACLTAKELGLYNPKYSVYFGDLSYTMEENEKYLSECLEIIE